MLIFIFRIKQDAILKHTKWSSVGDFLFVLFVFSTEDQLLRGDQSGDVERVDQREKSIRK